MRYMLLVNSDEAGYLAMSDEDRAALMQEYADYTTGLRESGAFVDGNQLQPTSTATTVRVRDGERLITDGPFAETKERLGGYFLIEADSLDEAIDFAARIPAARVGGIEVRPVVAVAAPTQG